MSLRCPFDIARPVYFGLFKLLNSFLNWFKFLNMRTHEHDSVVKITWQVIFREFLLHLPCFMVGIYGSFWLTFLRFLSVNICRFVNVFICPYFSRSGTLNIWHQFAPTFVVSVPESFLSKHRGILMKRPYYL